MPPAPTKRDTQKTSGRKVQTNQTRDKRRVTTNGANSFRLEHSKNVTALARGEFRSLIPSRSRVILKITKNQTKYLRGGGGGIKKLLIGFKNFRKHVATLREKKRCYDVYFRRGEVFSTSNPNY